MPQVCTVCAHPERVAIDTALVAGTSNRRVAAQFNISESGVRRHKAEHLTQLLAKAPPEPAHADALRAQAAAQEVDEQLHVRSVVGELERCFARMHLLFDACDGWLRDADDPTKYDIGPRAEEVTVTYTLPSEDGIPYRAKGKLSDLLAEVRESKGALSASAETKYADPRELVLRTAGQITSQTQLLAGVLDKMYNAREVERFEQTVLDAIRAAAPDVADAIARSLRQHQPLRPVVSGGDQPLLSAVLGTTTARVDLSRLTDSELDEFERLSEKIHTR